MAKAEPGSLMPVLGHRSVHLLWLFAQRSLTKSFPLLAARSGIGVGLLCARTWLAQLLCLSLPLSQVHKYFDTATVLSQFSALGRIQPLARSLCCGGLALRNFWLWLYFQLGEKAARTRNPLDGPSLVGRVVDMRSLLAEVAVPAITLGVVSIISHGCIANGLVFYCYPHTGLCSSERSPHHSLGRHQESTTTPFPALLCIPENIQLGKHSWIRANPGFPFSSLSSTRCSCRGKEKKGAREEAHFYLQVLSARSLCSSAPASTSCH